VIDYPTKVSLAPAKPDSIREREDPPLVEVVHDPDADMFPYGLVIKGTLIGEVDWSSDTGEVSIRFARRNELLAFFSTSGPVNAAITNWWQGPRDSIVEPDHLSLAPHDTPQITRIDGDTVEISLYGTWHNSNDHWGGRARLRMSEADLYDLIHHRLPEAMSTYFEGREPKNVIMAAMEKSDTPDGSLDDMATAVLAALKDADMLKEST
jgi:hypothetical protein